MAAQATAPGSGQHFEHLKYLYTSDPTVIKMLPFATSSAREATRPTTKDEILKTCTVWHDYRSTNEYDVCHGTIDAEASSRSTLPQVILGSTIVRNDQEHLSMFI